MIHSVILRNVRTATFTAGNLLVFDDAHTVFRCKTLELPWKMNRRNVSCIPEGLYTIHKDKTDRFPVCFRFENVPSRSGILIHNGNFTRQIEGCILVGSDHVDMDGDKITDVTYSKGTLEKLYETAIVTGKR